jgi:hypothetical protein
MKCFLLAVALVAGSVSAFAQTTTPAQPAYGNAQVALNVAPPSQAGQWAPQYGQPTMQKTHVQVYQELVQAKKDGQVAYLNSTIYAHH